MTLTVGCEKDHDRSHIYIPKLGKRKYGQSIGSFQLRVLASFPSLFSSQSQLLMQWKELVIQVHKSLQNRKWWLLTKLEQDQHPTHCNHHLTGKCKKQNYVHACRIQDETEKEAKETTVSFHKHLLTSCMT